MGIKYTFATDVFTKLGSLLSVTCRHCSVQAVRTESRSNRQFGSNSLGPTLHPVSGCLCRFVTASERPASLINIVSNTSGTYSVADNTRHFQPHAPSRSNPDVLKTIQFQSTCHTYPCYFADLFKIMFPLLFGIDDYDVTDAFCSLSGLCLYNCSQLSYFTTDDLFV